MNPALRRSSLGRTCALLVLVAAALLFGGGAAVAGYVDLFWDADPESLSWGGVRVPGMLVDRPDVLYPTSLPACGEGQLQLDLSRQDPAQLKQRRFTIGRFLTEGAGGSLVVPLSLGGCRKGRERDWVGGQFSDLSGSGWYDRPKVRDEVEVETATRLTGAAWAHRTGQEWTTGMAYYESDLDLSLTGRLLDHELDQPRGQARVPFSLAIRTLACEGVRRRDGELWGARLMLLEGASLLGVPVADERYELGWSGSGWGAEAFWRQDHAHERRFAHALYSRLDGHGEVLAGNMIRGADEGGYRRQELLVGRETRSPNWQRRTALTYRRRSVDWAGWADTGLVPGLSGYQYYAAFQFAPTTYSVAQGLRRKLGPRWKALGAANLTYATARLGAQMDRQRGIFSAPETVLDYRNKHLRALLLLLSAGVSHETRHSEARLLAGMAVGTSSSRLSDLDNTTGEPESGSGVGLGYLLSGSCTWKF